MFTPYKNRNKIVSETNSLYQLAVLRPAPTASATARAMQRKVNLNKEVDSYLRRVSTEQAQTRAGQEEFADYLARPQSPFAKVRHRSLQDKSSNLNTPQSKNQERVETLNKVRQEAQKFTLQKSKLEKEELAFWQSERASITVGRFDLNKNRQSNSRQRLYSPIQQTGNRPPLRLPPALLPTIVL